MDAAVGVAAKRYVTFASEQGGTAGEFDISGSDGGFRIKSRSPLSVTICGDSHLLAGEISFVGDETIDCDFSYLLPDREMTVTLFSENGRLSIEDFNNPPVEGFLPDDMIEDFTVFIRAFKEEMDSAGYVTWSLVY